jgi:hypothetical protein
MKILKLTALILLVSILAACVTPVSKDRYAQAYEERFQIQNVLPVSIEGFSYQGAIAYPDPWGYSLRYEYGENHMVYSDIYIYPVPSEMAKYNQNEIVNGMTNAALREIDLLKQRGAYSEFEVVGTTTTHLLGEYLKRVDIYLVKHNLASYSLLFLTEKDGKLIKARMTMPDNEANRNNVTWQKFINEIFSIIIENIDKA